MIKPRRTGLCTPIYSGDFQIGGGGGRSAKKLAATFVLFGAVEMLVLRQLERHATVKS